MATTKDAEPRYFMSYVWKYHRWPDERKVFACEVSSGEHPIQRILRWNSQHIDRSHVLLYWQEVPADTPEMDESV